MDTIENEPLRYKVGVLLIDGFALMSYASLVEPFRAANLLGGKDLYEVCNITLGATAQSSGAAHVDGQATVGDDLALDLLLVLAGGDPASFDDPAVFRWLGRMARSGVTLGGVSGGPVILARAGLMNNRRMTVHWEHAAALAEISPTLLIERSLYVMDRDRVTSAGGTAAMDLAHALIAQHHGPIFARHVSDWFLHTKIRLSGDPQRGSLVERVGTTNAIVLDVIDGMETHIADPLSLEHLARFAGVSSRQLNRVFRKIMGKTTMAYYRDLRLEKAQNLCRNSPLSLTEIALATGFSSSSHFSKAHSDCFGFPPSKIRA